VMNLFQNRLQVDLSSPYSKALYSARNVRALRSVVGDVVQKSNDPQLWFNLNETMKGQLLTLHLLQKQPATSAAEPDSILFLKQDLQEQIAQLSLENNPKNSFTLITLKGELEKVETQLNQTSSPKTFESAVKVSLDQTQENLPEQSLFVHLLESNIGYHLQFISNSEVKFHHILDKNEISNLAELFQTQLRNPAIPFNFTVSDSLFSHFIGPHQSWFNSFSDVILSLDGLWLTLPVDAFSQNGTFLATTHSVRSVHSASMGFALHKGKRWYSNSSLLLVSNPSFSENSSWQSLPFTQIEAASILKKSLNVTELSGKNATVSAFQNQLNQADFRFIHVATHGVTDVTPDQNRLVFSF
ncbi:CHAT domain-containing protein, partial [Nodularia spumigena]|uniref:CHAT domain-containing protein n=1 Tax=Nodularia spumigena TaxID=70799 RepID=UPI002B1F11F4